MSVLNAIQGISKLRKNVFKTSTSPQIQNSAITSQITNKSFQGQRKTRTLPNPPAQNAKGKQLTFTNKAVQHPVTQGTHISNGRSVKAARAPKKAFGLPTIKQEKFAKSIQ